MADEAARLAAEAEDARIVAEAATNVDGPRTLRDYLQPERTSTPSCIVLPANVGNVSIKYGQIQALPKFHGLDSESPYKHLKEFDEVCTTMPFVAVTQDVVKLKLFPFSLKEKAKTWLHSLRPNTIRTWNEMTREFLKKFFSIHKTTTLRKNIMNFYQNEHESFFECWERFKDLLSRCPRHGYEIWRVINFFYEGMNSGMHQFVEMMCSEKFLNKSPDDAWSYFDSLAENAQNWDTSGTADGNKSKALASSRHGMYVLNEEHDLNAKIASLHRKVDAIQKPNLVKVVDPVEHACGICESLEHYTKDCPTIPAFQEVLHDQANSMDTYKRPFSSPYSETYNPNWRKNPTMNGVNVPQGSSSSNPYVPPHKNSLEDTLHTFMQGQTQINQNVMKTLDELKTSIVRIESRLNVREKGTLPAQTQPNPKGKNSNLEQANVVTTLRSGKVIETPMKVDEPEKSPKLKSSHNDIQNEQSEIDKKVHAPFPRRLSSSTKQLADNKDILDVFQQVKINIPLLSVIKQFPAYAKFLNDLCTVKRKHNVQKKAFLTEQVSSIHQHNTPPKYKDPRCPTISCIIGDFMIKQALLDLGASVNLLPFSVYEQFGLGGLKPTSVTLQLADRSVKVPRGVVENVLIQIDKFYYPVDFIVLDTQLVANASKEIHVILGRPFLATANALINCRTGIMNLSFGNMTVELNIFDACKDPGGKDDIHEVNMVETCVQ
ncbi:uncharacterized protein LOC113345782 [Papaver somniferum]|uniref:uncharacterized protein LOC113345782 n=1 Tax=Papaver somniferum TaxID=3469 RepID=UPI000E7014DC|nr:uncharacterized protein LOC113345782 [Papaver somniferum]